MTQTCKRQRNTLRPLGQIWKNENGSTVIMRSIISECLLWPRLRSSKSHCKPSRMFIKACWLSHGSDHRRHRSLPVRRRRRQQARLSRRCLKRNKRRRKKCTNNFRLSEAVAAICRCECVSSRYGKPHRHKSSALLSARQRKICESFCLPRQQQFFKRSRNYLSL